MSAPFVTTSRDTLAEALARHGMAGSVPAGFLCACGWEGYDIDAHVAAALISAGVVVTVESLATNEALVEKVALAAYGPEKWPVARDEAEDRWNEATDWLRALAVALGAKP